MLKVFIDGNHFQDQMRNCEIKEGQEFHLRLAKIDHGHQGKWDVYFESIPQADEIRYIPPDCIELDCPKCGTESREYLYRQDDGKPPHLWKCGSYDCGLEFQAYIVINQPGGDKEDKHLGCCIKCGGYLWKKMMNGNQHCQICGNIVDPEGNPISYEDSPKNL